jgi:hypothetical protein
MDAVENIPLCVLYLSLRRASSRKVNSCEHSAFVPFQRIRYADYIQHKVIIFGKNKVTPLLLIEKGYNFLFFSDSCRYTGECATVSMLRVHVPIKTSEPMTDFHETCYECH